MSAPVTTTDRSRRTRSFARVLGPFIAVVPAIVAIRAGSIGSQLSSFSADPMWSWSLGALLFLCGVFIIAFHQYWRSVAAVIISLFGWFLLLRGLALLTVPQLIVEGAESATQTSDTAVDVVRVGFGLLAVCGLYLAYVGWVKKPD
ncbi:MULTISPECIES: hypothetical protein [Mycolicibacterium]|jgi:hypothetical protein|uniref:Uncharacterized protein n=2 Tax=Mycolicibacterium TaxID=1866885 RepID=A1TEA4_MYCVP|nr:MULTISPECIES: hypothetical protein [Mycolicibacterium]ABM15504.1 conserved hypothetical protein [Mycolicibacterium vanbaalenii PYR-1]MCV7130765.1 hypothetical protein [Mycolicibacterium vanbaalenii PYR-1]MDN4522173.1 hypothetical protein [Mycolicibacterium austroafricanum]MDW5614974.1 hypothetical protein [Mycolicibacterium sp. D5.8-2]PQP51237.1 hypothetical protein C6A88_08500 [Mycolicibacterium austroafricanum]